MSTMNNNFNQDKVREFLKDVGVQFSENSMSFILTCPKCSKPKKLYIRKKDGAFICFRCANDGFKGTAEKALSEISSMSVEDVKEKIYNNRKFVPVIKFDLGLKDFWNEEPEVKEILTNKEVSYPEHYVKIDDARAIKGMDYLTKTRGLTKEVAVKYNVMYNPKWDTVVFPIISNEKLLGWQERGTNKNFKYTLKGFNKNLNLMFEDNLKNSEHAILTEGPMDALKADLCGGNVCSMGKIVSNEQLKIITSSVKKLYVALDPDAIKEIRDICKKVSGEVEVFIMTPPPGKKDLGECSFEEVLSQFKNAKRYGSQLFLSME